LVTLTGVAGVGKSRLAARVATRVQRSFRDGAWLAELGGLQDPSLVPQAICDALRIPDQTARDQMDMLAQMLADRQLLLVMDNCEHLLPRCASVVAALLRAAPDLRVLVTSRQKLGIPAERVFQVAPLAVPEPDESVLTATGLRYPGVVLFVERAAAVRAGFTLHADNVALVSRICSRLEGIPLAIELAAARMRSLSLAQLADLLDDRFRLLVHGNRAALPRQQTLRAAVAWSFDLCTQPERSLWLHASVFAGRFDVQALAAVCGCADEEVYEPLAGLVDKSVVIAERDDTGLRYRMLDTLREFGLLCLRKPGSSAVPAPPDEAVLRRRHRDFYITLAERFDADWFGPRQAEWTRRMRAERVNLRAALGYCLDSEQDERVGVGFAGSLYHFWWGCGEVREGRLWLERALAADARPSRERTRALAAYSRVLLVQGLPAEVAAPASECLDLARRFDEPPVVADASQILGLSLVYCGARGDGIRLLEQAVALAGRLGSSGPPLALASLMLALVVLFDDDPARTGDLLAQSRRICRLWGDQWWLGIVLNVSVMVALRLGDVGQAEAFGREALHVRRELNDPVGSGGALELLAWVAADTGQYRRAARLLGAAEGQWRILGGSAFGAGRWLTEHQARETVMRQALGAAFDTEFGHGSELALAEAVAYALGERRRPVQEPPAAGCLTQRETEVAALIAQGLSNREIAAKLVISQRTVESHTEHILTKLGYTTRTQVATWYAQH
jgi:predicted ATPase/DNA-binding NarL/FixJ family response regulator